MQTWYCLIALHGHAAGFLQKKRESGKPGCRDYFEDEEGEIEDIFAEKMPFDVDADVIEIMDEDYGIWFVDAWITRKLTKEKPYPLPQWY